MIKLQATGVVSAVKATSTEKVEFYVEVKEIVEFNGQTATKKTTILCSVKPERVENMKVGDAVFIRGNGDFNFRTKKDGSIFAFLKCNPSWLQIGKDNEKMHNVFMEVIGYVGGAPEIREHEQKRVCNFSVASNEKILTDDGELIEKTIWTRASVWKAIGKEKLFDYIKSGICLFIAGKPVLNVYEKDGKKNVSLECRVSELQFVGGKKSDNNTSKVSDQQSESDCEFDPNAEDDLPF